MQLSPTVLTILWIMIDKENRKLGKEDSLLTRWLSIQAIKFKVIVAILLLLFLAGVIFEYVIDPLYN